MAFVAHLITGSTQSCCVTPRSRFEFSTKVLRSKASSIYRIFDQILSLRETEGNFDVSVCIDRKSYER